MNAAWESRELGLPRNTHRLRLMNKKAWMKTIGGMAWENVSLKNHIKGKLQIINIYIYKCICMCIYIIFSIAGRDSPLPPPSSPAPTKTRWTSTPLVRLSAPSEYPALCFNTRPPKLRKRTRKEDTPVLWPPRPCTPCSTPLRSPSVPAQTIRQNQTPRLRPNKRHHTQTQNCAVSSICPELVSVALCALHRLTRCHLSPSFWTEMSPSACHSDTQGSKHENSAPLQSVVTSAPVFLRTYTDRD